MNRQDKIKKLYDEIMGRGYGKTLSHEEIAFILGEREGSTQYRSLVSSVQKKLIESGKMIENVRGVGYRIIYPDEYTGQSVKCVMSGARKIDSGAKMLRYAPVKDMTVLGAQEYHRTADRMAILQAAVAGARVELSMLSNRRKNPLEIALYSEESKRIMQKEGSA